MKTETKTYHLTDQQITVIEHTAILSSFHMNDWIPGTPFGEVRENCDGTGIDSLVKLANDIMSQTGIDQTISHDLLCFRLWGETYEELNADFDEEIAA